MVDRHKLDEAASAHLVQAQRRRTNRHHVAQLVMWLSTLAGMFIDHG